MSTILGMIPMILMMTAPILITAVGGMISERSGVTNIALEGLLCFGGCAAAIAHKMFELAGMQHSLSIFLALVIGALISGAVSLIHAYTAIDLGADQTISGTGINLLATGATIFASQIFFKADRTKEFELGMQTDALGIYPTAYLAAVIVILSWFVLYKTPYGMHLRACGEHPAAADSVGINVRRIRYQAVLVSGILGGLAGGCVVLTQTIQYTSNTINGKGFIALAAVSFGRWTPLGVTLASLLFGAAQAFSVVATNFQALKALPSDLFNILPYLITLLALIFTSGKNYAPAEDGKPYTKGAS